MYEIGNEYKFCFHGLFLRKWRPKVYVKQKSNLEEDRARDSRITDSSAIWTLRKHLLAVLNHLEV